MLPATVKDEFGFTIEQLVNRIVVILGCAAYFLALVWAYHDVQSVLFRSVGFRLERLSQETWVLCFAMAMVPSLFLRVALKQPSDLCHWVLYLSVIVPGMFLPYHVLGGSTSLTFPLPLALLLCFLALLLFRQVPSAQPLLERVRSTFSVPRHFVRGGLIAYALVLSLYVLRTAPSLTFDLSLDIVYERRLAAEDVIQAGRIFAYLIAALASSVAPLLVCVAYRHRDPFCLCAGLLAFVTMFAVAGAKMDLFAPLFLLGIYVIVAKCRNWCGIVIVGGAAALTLASTVEYLGFGSYRLAKLLIGRQFFTPSLMTSFYWEYFSEHHLNYFSDGFLRWLVKPQHHLPTPRLIGEAYFWGPDTNANGNIWAAAFAELGYLGMGLMTLALAAVLWIVDNLARLGQFTVIAMMSTFFGVIWCNVPLQTSMLSNGVALSLVVFMLLNCSTRPAASTSTATVEPNAVKPGGMVT